MEAFIFTFLNSFGLTKGIKSALGIYNKLVNINSNWGKFM
jgi:hypothetical protein